MKNTKNKFKIEIRKTCKVCNSSITENRFRSYCSAQCRIKFHNTKHRPDHKEWQRMRRAKIAIIPDKKKIQCQICSMWYHKIMSHVRYLHKMTAKEYKQEFGYDVKRGLLSDKARSRIRKHTLSNGTINNLKNGKRYWYKS